MILFQAIFLGFLAFISFLAIGAAWMLFLGLFFDKLPPDWIVLLPPVVLTVGLWCLIVVKANKEKAE
jgi:hypothetical protein